MVTDTATTAAVLINLYVLRGRQVKVSERVIGAAEQALIAQFNKQRDDAESTWRSPFREVA
jgi:hypothetical protein